MNISRIFLFVSFFCCLLSVSAYTQNPTPPAVSTVPPAATTTTTAATPQTPSCRLIYDENQHLVLPQKGLVIVYFYNPRNSDSLKMTKLFENLKMANYPTTCFQVDVSLSLGLKRTYRVSTLPALVVLQDKRVIYGMTGFTDTADVFQQYLEEGIKTHLIVSPEK